MKQFHGLPQLKQELPPGNKTTNLARILLDDLQHCHCRIYGNIADNDQILLAELNLVEGALSYDTFDQRIDLKVAGPILRNDCVPLTYRLQGKEFAISGRCSILRKICGVDLYLQTSYTGQTRDIAQQNFSIDIKALLKM